jgi:hypothetical protein
MLRATFKSRSLGYPELAPLLPRKNENIGDGGSIASTFGTENTSFATGWPIRRPIAKSEEDWSTGFAKCITNASSNVGAGENKNGSDLIPRDEPVLAGFGKRARRAFERLAKLTRTTRRAPAVAIGSRSLLTRRASSTQKIPGTETGMQPLYLARIEDLGRSDFVNVDCAAVITSPCCRRSFCFGSG